LISENNHRNILGENKYCRTGQKQNYPGDHSELPDKPQRLFPRETCQAGHSRKDGLVKGHHQVNYRRYGFFSGRIETDYGIVGK
jgi:hypothetical protein